MSINTQIEELKAKNLLLQKEIDSISFDLHRITNMFKNTELIMYYNKNEKDTQTFYNRLFLQNCPDIIMLLDADMKFILGTKSLEIILPTVKMSSLPGKKITDIFKGVDDKWAAKILDNCQFCFESKLPVFYDDGIGGLNFNITVRCIFDSNGVKKGIVVVMHDNTELYNSLVKACNGNKIKSQFLAQISHEIRTPMNAIKGMGDLLLLSKLSPVQKEYSRGIALAAGSLLTIINDVLDFSKIEAGKLEIINHDYDFASFISDSCNICYVEAMEKGLSFYSDIDPNIPMVMYGDDIRVRQVLSNLLSNAVKYTSSGFVKLTVSQLFPKPGKVKLIFVVEDTGVGVSSENIGYLFEPFLRMEKQEYTTKGNGLGLAISSRLLKMMGSELKVTSHVGKGSVFSFELEQTIIKGSPLAKVDKPVKALLFCSKKYQENYSRMLFRLKVQHRVVDLFEELLTITADNGFTHIIYELSTHDRLMRSGLDVIKQLDKIAVNDKTVDLPKNRKDLLVLNGPILINTLAKAIESPSFVKKHNVSKIGDIQASDVEVLLVDDNKVNLMVGEAILQHYNIKVDKAENGMVAVSMFKEKKYDMILMDHMMPIMDGMQATEIIRGSGGWGEKVPIIALTANNSESIKKDFIAGGMNGALSKPVDVTELNKVLIKFLPKEKIIHEHSSDMLEKFEMIGLDTAKAMIHYPSLRDFVDKLKIVCAELPGIVSDLTAFNLETDNILLTLELINLTQKLNSIGAKEYSRKANILIHAIDESNTELFNEHWNSLVGDIILLAEKISSVIK